MKPKFVVTPEDVDVQDGSSARLDCEVIGHPRPVITWTFNDGPVDRQRTGIAISSCVLHSDVLISIVDRMLSNFHLFFPLSPHVFRVTELLASGGLVIRQVRQRDAGTYRCTGGNSLGKISAPAQLRVLSK